jgi:hypothetical protein
VDWRPSVLGAGSSAYYRWATYGVSPRRREADAELVDLIRRIQEEHHYRYGSPRVRRKFIPTTRSNHGLEVCENILNREFQTELAGTKWVSSYQRYAITYLRTRGGWVYLTVGKRPV